jgi:hypothetical protein
VSTREHENIMLGFSVIHIDFIRPFYHSNLFLESARGGAIVTLDHCNPVIPWGFGFEEACCQSCGIFSLGEKITRNWFTVL